MKSRVYLRDFCNDFFEILEIQESWISCQGSILGMQGSILQRQTTLHIARRDFCKISKKAKIIFGPKHSFFSNFQVEIGRRIEQILTIEEFYK